MERANGGALPDQYRHFLDLQTKKATNGETNGVSGLTKLSQESVDPGWLRRGALTCALVRIIHRFSSRSDESDDLTRRATEAPANVLSEYVEEAGGTRLRVAATQ